jgi:hypothetical protein
MNDEKTRERSMYAVIAFNVIIIFWMILFALLRGGISYLHFFDFVGGLLFATAGAGGVFWLVTYLDL